MINIETQLLTVRQFTQKYPWPTESGLRALIYSASKNENKFHTAFKRVGRRVLIDQSEFWSCIDRIQEHPGNDYKR
jgi:hypothetical protein